MSAQVAIVMGSTSDAPIMAVAEETLKGLGIEHETRVLSAHRTPDEVRDWARGLAGRGIKVVIAAAGGAAASALSASRSAALGSMDPMGSMGSMGSMASGSAARSRRGMPGIAPDG